MPQSTTYHVRPSEPYSAHIPLTIADSFMVQLDSVYLYLFCTANPLDSDESSHLINVLTQSLANFIQHPSHSRHDPKIGKSELLGKIYDDPATGNLTVIITPSSSIPFTVVDRSSDVCFADLRPDASFPVQLLKPSVFGPGITVPPPDAAKGVQALWIQLTLLDGGFAIHVHIHHWIAGAASAGRFVEAWFERARLLSQATRTRDGTVRTPGILLGERKELTDNLRSVTVTQLEHPDLLHVPSDRRVWAGLDLHPVLLSLLIKLFTFVIAYLPFLLPRSDVQIFHFPPDALESLRNDTRNGAGDGRSDSKDELTANDCLTALFWSCITRARFPPSPKIRTNSSLNSTILTAVDFRSRLNPPLDQDLFGNSNLDVYTTLPVSMLSSSTTSASRARIAAEIHQSISSLTNLQVRSTYQVIASRPRIFDTRKRPLKFQYGTDLINTSWEHVHKDPNLLALDILPTDGNDNKNNITFEKMRCMMSEGTDGAFVVFPAYGRKWKTNRSERGGNAARQNGLEVVVTLTRQSMKRLTADEVFRKYARWGEAGGYIMNGIRMCDATQYNGVST